MSDEVTIDVGPVFCPSCKREFGNTERDRLASLVEKLRPYLDHDSVCAQSAVNWVMGQKSDPCDCGLADLLTEMENQ